MWAHCGAGNFTQCLSAARGCVRGSWHRLGPMSSAAPSVGHRGFSPVFFLPVRASSQCEVSNAGVAPVHPDASVHLPLLGSFPSPESLQDFLCCRISTCIFDKSILKDHCLSSSDSVCFFEKRFTFLAISLNIPFPCISCFVLSHSMIFQYIIVAATSSNAVLVKHVQFSKSAFASFF